MHNSNILYDIGIIAGYGSAILWFIVLIPQIWYNYKRQSTEGLSILWALMNFSASLVSIFFSFYENLPLYSKSMSVYMPILEAIVLIQFLIYRERSFNIYDFILIIICFIFWSSVIFIQLHWPETISDIQWIATFFWSVNTFPQLILNAKLRTTRGQAPLSVLVTICGKTTDSLSTFLVNMPAQTRVVCFYSSFTAYVDALQVIYYAWELHKDTLITINDDIEKESFIQSEYTNNNTTDKFKHELIDHHHHHHHSKEEGLKMSGIVACCCAIVVIILMIMLIIFVIVVISWYLNIILLISEAILIAICIGITWNSTLV